MSELQIPPGWRRERPRSKLAVPIGIATMALMYVGPGLAQDYTYSRLSKAAPQQFETKHGNNVGTATCDSLTVNATDTKPYTVGVYASTYTTGAAKLKGVVYSFQPGRQIEVDYAKDTGILPQAVQEYENLNRDSVRHIRAWPIYELNGVEYGGAPVCEATIQGIIKMEPVG